MTNIYHALPDETPEPDFQGKWTCFKGGIDDGEDEKSAARREFQEESTFTWNGQLDDSKIVQNKKVKIWLVDAADLDPSKFNRNDVHKITGDYLNGMPEIWSIGWFSPEEAQSKLANNQKDLIPQAVEILTDSADIPEEPENEGAPMSFALNENANITTLHIFDFDDTIAFTTSYTQVSVPEGETEAAKLLSQLDKEPTGPPYALDQHGLDTMFRELGSEDELAARGFDLDFSSFKTVASNSPLNPVIARRINDCCLAGGRDPNGDFYVLTARAAAAEGAGRPRGREAACGGRGEGACYLVFLTSNAGCLLMHWSDTPIDGALASFVPAKPVPRFKYTQNAGRTEVARDMNMKVRKFYQGYAYFLKTAANLGGTFRLRTQLKQLPIAVYLNAAALEVKMVRVGESATFSGVKGIAVLPALSTDLDVGTMETRLFLQTAERVGAGLALDSGVGGIDSDLSARRLSRAGSNAAPPSPFVSGGALPS